MAKEIIEKSSEKIQAGMENDSVLPPSLPDSKWTLQPTELRCHILPAT